MLQQDLYKLHETLSLNISTRNDNYHENDIIKGILLNVVP